MHELRAVARLSTIAAGAAAAFVLGVTAPAAAAPVNGANADCGAYCPAGVGEASGNGYGRAAAHANGLPGAGTVGRADSKFPPGQSPDGTDRNNGYECDGNGGVGQTNPAHSGCDASGVSQTG